MRKLVRHFENITGVAGCRLVVPVICMVMSGAVTVPAATNAFFSAAYIGSGALDTSVGLDAAKTYFNAVNLNGGALTINGVNFEASTGGNPTGTTWSFSNESSVLVGGVANNLTGQLGSLVNDFIYGGAPGLMTLSNLTAGQTYVLTFYNRTYEAAGGGRIQTIISSSGASTVFDEDIGAPGLGMGTLLRYTFAATGSTETVMFSPLGSGTMHLYGFSTEQVFNKAWSSGASWSSAVWSPAGAPNGVGSNASLTAAAISSPTTITLSGPTTLGHLQFAGSNAYTIAGGGNTLTMQADIGGVATLVTTNGSHLISAPVVMGSDTVKFGDGTMIISGDIAGSGKGLKIYGGTLVLAGSNINVGSILNNSALVITNSVAQTLNCNFSGSGSLMKNGPGTLTLAGSNTCSGIVTINGGGLDICNTSNAVLGAVAGSGLLVKSGSGTMVFSGINLNTGDTVINAGKLTMWVGSVVVSNYSFETYDPLGSNMKYQPTSASWTFASNAGINTNSGPFYIPNAPDGIAGAFIQGSGGGISQSITVSTDGFYNISFQAVGRGTIYGPNGLLLQVDGAIAGCWEEAQFSQAAWQGYSVNIYISAGVHVLLFSGNNRLGGDRSTCIDNVVISAPAGRLSTSSVLKLDNGAVFDPSGTTQTVHRLYLGGQPQNHGTYGAAGSGAKYINNTYFTGTGMIDVLHDPSGTVIVIR